MKTIFARVTRVESITPRLRRVTFASDQAAEFVTPYPDQFATLLFPLPHQDAPVIEPGFTWEEYQAMPEDVRPVVRNYTVRGCRPESGEIDVDFVLHGEGFGSTWAEHAQPGQIAGLWGPRVGYNPAPDVMWQLLVGDETAVPAIAAILEALPAGVSAHVIIEVADALDEIPLTSAATFEVAWLHRGDTPRGPDGPLLAAVEQITIPETLVYGWGGGEIDTIQAYGRLLRRKHKLKTSQISAIGYWRREAN